jgi:predicted membrane-bound dolichyl-phosphate-mannose-protein mannosyltransferase
LLEDLDRSGWSWLRRAPHRLERHSCTRHEGGELLARGRDGEDVLARPSDPHAHIVGASTIPRRRARNARRRIESTLRRQATPLALLAIISLLSLAARVAWISEPCHSPCRTAADHTLVFDELYYVNAARAIAGLPSQAADDPYATAPRGVDPNAEHPQLAKLAIAASIEAFGDGPAAWRLGSLVFGSLAILGMFVLVRAAGGGRWLAVGAAALMAADNLLLVHGRIATLDIYVVAFMIWGAALYLRGKPITAGALIGAGTCMKLVAPYALVALAAYEALHFLLTRPPDVRRRALALIKSAAAAAAVFVALLAVLDQVAPPYDQVAHTRITGGPFAHISHMLHFAAGQTSRHGPRGIASYPWQWLGDYKPIVYLNIVPSEPAPGLAHLHPASHFLGVISPPILLLALPGLALAAWRARRTATDLDILALAWFLGTFVPFELLSLFWSRTSYLYYMVIVMPGIYIAIVRLLAHPALTRRKRPRQAVAVWVLTVLAAVIVMYPFTPLPG